MNDNDGERDCSGGIGQMGTPYRSGTESSSASGAAETEQQRLGGVGKRQQQWTAARRCGLGFAAVMAAAVNFNLQTEI